MNLPPPPQAHPPQPPPPQAHPSPHPPPEQLTKTLSTLTNLLTFSHQILSTTPQPQTLTSNLIPCPFNPNHLIPPPSLFHHHLRCSSAPRSLPHLDHLLSSLSYPNTLHNPQSTHLSSYLASISNFFYHNCPGVVTFPEQNSVATNATHAAFHLPDFLFLECSDSVTVTPNCKPISFVPSEYFYITREIESWNQFPVTYSVSVHRAILGIGVSKESELASWLLSNSLRYGVVIDVSMQRHIFLLFVLCIKSILKDESVLNKALVWLESQVSILYGGNGKLFVLNFVKKCILVGASALVLFPLVNEVDDSVGLKHENSGRDWIQERKISMPQVVAAVAALHERALFDRKIKGFWFSPTSNNYQLVAEHCYLSNKANEERNRRVDYRPIIDYDWVHRQNKTQQESQKEKTQEELLAEERDYKRRRMSYRGKKRNQSALQVMRDMIGEYMEEIKQAGGVKSPVKGSDDIRMPPPPPKLPSSNVNHVDANNSEKVSHDLPAVTISNPGYSDKRKSAHDAISKDYEQHKQRHHKSHHYGGDQQTADQGNHRSRASESPESQRNHSRSHERRIHHKNEDYSNRKKYNNTSRTNDRWQNDKHKNHISDSTSGNVFSERYDPSQHHDIGQHDISSDGKYVKAADRFYEKELN